MLVPGAPVAFEWDVPGVPEESVIAGLSGVNEVGFAGLLECRE